MKKKLLTVIFFLVICIQSYCQKFYVSPNLGMQFSTLDYHARVDKPANDFHIPEFGFDLFNKKGKRFLNVDLFYYQGLKNMIVTKKPIPKMGLVLVTFSLIYRGSILSSSASFSCRSRWAQSRTSFTENRL